MNEIDSLDRLLAAHGGRETWSQVAAISACLSSGGLAYASRLRPDALRRNAIVVRLAQRRVSVLDYPRPGWWGEWQGDQVRIGPDGGAATQTRAHARRRFKGWLAQPRWDDLDLLYFVGYAVWNYLSFPRLLELPGVAVRTIRGGGTGQPTLLAARFPDAIPTHSAQQYFHLDADGLLRRHDYVAEVFGAWAAGANHCLRSEMIDGLRLYTRRRVTPSLGRWASLPFPTLVWIDFDEIVVHRTQRTPDPAVPHTTMRGP